MSGRFIIAGAVAGALVVAAGLVFEPWTALTSSTAHETLVAETTTPTALPPSPSPSPSNTPTTKAEKTPASPRRVAAGDLVGQEHDTTGSIEVFTRPDGRSVLQVRDLATLNGPDLHVWLSDAPVIGGVEGWRVFDDGAYVDLGPLRANRGDLVYPIPRGTDLAKLRSVSIWCARFHVSFGAAALTRS